MPEGKVLGSATMVPSAARETCQQSSMLTYLYPASRMPVVTIASAISRMSFSLTLHWNLFQLFHPMGGVGAAFDTCADAVADAVRKMKRDAMSSLRTWAPYVRQRRTQARIMTRRFRRKLACYACALCMST